jgi:hypothetical protein
LIARGLNKMAKLPVEKLKASKAVPVRIVSDAVPARDDDDRERKYRARSALEDIERAEDHRRDKSLMKDVKSLAKDKVASLKKIC